MLDTKRFTTLVKAVMTDPESQTPVGPAVGTDISLSFIPTAHLLVKVTTLLQVRVEVECRTQMSTYQADWLKVLLDQLVKPEYLPI